MAKLRRVLGLVELTFYGVGIIIGAGIYAVIGAAAGVAGEGLWLSFVLGAVIALLTGLSYAELATTYPQAGAEYVYLRQAAPAQRWASFGAGFIIIMSGAATAAAVSLAFAGYLQSFVSIPAWLVALMLLIGATLLNIAGIQQSSWVNIVFTILEVVGLIVVIGAGIITPGFGSAILEAPPDGVIAGAAIIFFVYLGFEEIANLAEEAEQPARDLPRSIFISLGLTTALYVLVGLAVVALVAPDELAASDAPLALAAGAAAPALADGIAVIALFATANTVLTVMIVTSRMLFGMARGGDMPSIFERVQPQAKTPWVAALASLVVSGLLIPFGEVALVASLSSLASLLAFAAVNIALIVLRYRDPDRKRPFAVPLSVGRFPILPALGILSSLALATQFQTQVYPIAAVILLIGISLYFAQRLWDRP